MNKFKEWLFYKLWPNVDVEHQFLMCLQEIDDVFYSVPQPEFLKEKYEEAIAIFAAKFRQQNEENAQAVKWRAQHLSCSKKNYFYWQ